MKTILKLTIVSVFTVSLFACGNKNPSNPQPIAPVPKPGSPEQTAAFAAKKADYFIRLAFDLADGYLYDESVARKRYGTDSNYVSGLNFSRAYAEGIITSRDLGTFDFWYYRDGDGHYVSTGAYNVKITSYVFGGGDDLRQKRSVVVNTANANHPAKRFDIKFTGADTGTDNFTFDVWYSSEGFSTAKGAEIFVIDSPTFTITDSSGTANSFTVSFSNIKGKIKNAEANYTPGPSYDFVIEEGNLTLSGLGYEIKLSYSNNKAQGTFTGPDEFSASIKLNEDGHYGAFYIVDSAPDITRHIGWDFP